MVNKQISATIFKVDTEFHPRNFKKNLLYNVKALNFRKTVGWKYNVFRVLTSEIHTESNAGVNDFLRTVNSLQTRYT